MLQNACAIAQKVDMEVSSFLGIPRCLRSFSTEFGLFDPNMATSAQNVKKWWCKSSNQSCA